MGVFVGSIFVSSVTRNKEVVMFEIRASLNAWHICRSENLNGLKGKYGGYNGYLFSQQEAELSKC